MDYTTYQEEVYSKTMDLVKVDLIRLSSGNLSVRTFDGNAAITPSGISYDVLTPQDVLIINFDGELVLGDLKPSSEYQLHLEIYKANPHVNAVVHTHSKYAIAFSCTVQEIPNMCIEIFSVGGPIPVVPYSTPGTLEVGLDAAKYFANRKGLKAAILENHGLVAIGDSLDAAYQNAYKAETGAEIYHLALQTGQEVKCFNDQQIRDIVERYQKPKESK